MLDAAMLRRVILYATMRCQRLLLNNENMVNTALLVCVFNHERVRVRSPMVAVHLLGRLEHNFLWRISKCWLSLESDYQGVISNAVLVDALLHFTDLSPPCGSL